MITYNNKDILKSFIGNKRVIKKYLNNKIVYGIPDFAQYYNIQGYDNYEVVGNPTITEGMVSNFSSINYITVPAFSPSDSTWKIVTKFKLTDTTTNQIIFSNNYQPNKQLQLSVQNSKLKVYLSTNGTSSNLANGVFGTYTISADTIYWVKFEFTGSAYIISYSVDGITWTTDITINSTATLINVSNNMFFGKNTHPSFPEPLTSGSILYLKDTYIEVNGNYWFNGNSNYKELLDCNPNVYLQNNSNWNAYIDTGIIPSNNVKFEISAQLVDTTIKDGALLGCRKSSAATTSNFLLWYNNLVTGYGAFNYGMAYKNNWSPGISDPYQKQTYLYNGNNVYINDVLQTDGYDANKSAFNTDLTIYLFGYRADNILQARTFRGRIYNFKFWDGDTLMQHLVPVPVGLQIGSYKVPSNGMFDIVTQTFYENKGSGEFIWGVDL